MVTRKGNPRSITNHLNPLPNLLTPGAFLDAIGSSSFDRTMSLGSHLFAIGIDPLTGLPDGETHRPGLCSSFASPRGKLERNSPAPAFAPKKTLPSSMNWASTLAGPLLFDVESTPPSAPERSESGVHVQPHGHAGLSVASAEDRGKTLTSTGAVATLSTPTRLDGRTITQFINPLPNLLTPRLFLDARGGGTFDISMREGRHDFGLGAAFAATPAWGYHSSSASLWDDLGLNYLGPTIVAQEGVPISINWTNDLPTSHLLKVDTTLHGAHESMHGGVHVQPHVHGGLTVASSDGNPFASGAFLGTETYDYRNAQSALTSWYHDHALGITRLNVYAGLAGFYIIRDTEDIGIGDNPKTPVDDNPLDLPGNYFGVDYQGDSLADPDAAYEFPIVIQDKTFDGTGNLYYPAIPGDPMAGPGNPEVEAPPDVPNSFPGAPTSPTVVPEYGGDVVIVNGVAWPTLNVEPGTYRFRLLNGSDSRFYELKLPQGLDFQVIGSDNGLLDGPAVPIRNLPIAPGERYDVIIDFSRQAGNTVTLRNVAGGTGERPIFNDPQTTGQIMQFHVQNLEPSIPDPVNPQWKIDLRPTETLPVWSKNTDGTWKSSLGTTTSPGAHALAVFEGLDPYGRIFPHLGTVNEGSLLLADSDGAVVPRAAETVDEDEFSLFEIYNTTPDAHPIHLHGTEFQILERQKFKATLLPKDLLTEGGLTAEGSTFADSNGNGNPYDDIILFGQAKPVAAYEAGYKDTAVVNPGERILVVARYDPALLDTPVNDDTIGKYVWHCHILSHEDHEMMRPLQVVDVDPVSQVLT